ncbi:DUF1015 family protein [Nocardioides mangrovicus]|uniref:DUF1015 family protein n=1 Tax=Nocardioides mangrovicus TaxID=2478913 RepID=A0A3L8P6H4_9ACTN|nr:DUF1015 family protein [Nocardioides mangrovicus]RLV50303.1 DUF1015 family protein [Nocardioides mangrovicus]
MTGFVHPFDGALVRPDDAGRLVVPMPQSGDETTVPFEPGAYEDEGPAFYRYRQATPSGDGTGTHVGIVASMDAPAFADGRVRGHEEVLPERVAALVDHLSQRPARIELVTTLHDAGPRFLAALADDVGDPAIEVGTADGVEHAVWRLGPLPDLAAELSSARHYLADGHHRAAASLRLWERAGRPARFGVGVVVYALDGLSLEAHRRPPGEEVLVPSLAEVIATADAGRTVPPKTTWFRPKPASGLFVRV